MQYRQRLKKNLSHLLPALLLVACTAQKRIAEKPIKSLRFLGEYCLPETTGFSGTRVGGLSGIDYNPDDGLYYLISDDRSDYNPARFYKARIGFSEKGIDSVQFVGVVNLRRKDGEVYPNKTQDSLHVPDPEAIRLNRKNGTLVWASEGERIVRKDHSVLQNPSVNIVDPNGTLIDTLPLPADMHMQASEKGPRRNGVFEGLAFDARFNTLYVSVEEPLYEDGPRAGLGDTTGWVRILRYDLASKMPTAQYAYRLDAVVREPIPTGGFNVNGVVDILFVNDRELLVTERSFSSGYLGCNVRVYKVDVTDAADVSAVLSLQKTPPRQYLKKTLLVNFDLLGREVYNIEGASFDPLLPNGKQSLLFVADDNFSGKEKTQFLLFEVNK